MKKLINRLLVTIALLCGYCSATNAQSTAIPYQGVARSSTGAIIASQPISIRFTILQGSASGTMVYQETHNTTTNALGLFDVQLTRGTPTTGAFDPASWQVLAAAGAFLKTELDFTGGSAYVDMGTTQLLSVPFAMYAERSGSSLGAVVYAGTWDAASNNPPLTSAAGTKGTYYVVINAGNTALDGINDWEVRDWAIFNGTSWEKVDNSEAAVTAGAVVITPGGDITATNVQDAIVELDTKTHDPSHITQDATHRFVTDTEKLTWNNKADKVAGAVSGHIATLSASGDLTDSGVSSDDFLKKDNTTAYTPTADYNPATKKYVDDNTASKVNKSGDTMTGNLILNADPTVDMGAATKKYVDDNTASVSASKVNKSGDTMTGNLILNADPTVDMGAATKKYVDDNTASVSASKVNKSGDTMTGDLILNADPSTALGAATKQYVDDNTASVSTSKVNKSGDTMTGDLILNADPTVDMGAATKKYVDDNTASVSASKVNKSGDTMTGDLILNADPSAALGAATKQYVDGQFVNLVDSYIHRTDDGVSIYLPPSGTRKRFGIGDTEPTSPLGILAEGSEQRVIRLSPNTLNPGGTYSFRLTGSVNPGFNLEEDNTSAGSVSRLFVQQSTGMVGIGTVQPTQRLHIESSDAGAITGIKILNTASLANNGWVIGHLNDAVTPERDGAFAIMEGTAPGNEKMVVLSSGNIGVNEPLPDTKLHVSKPVSDPTADVSLSAGTGIMVIGPMTQHIVADYRGIQARKGEYTGSSVSLSVDALNLQPLGGNIIIHGNQAANKRVIIKSDGSIGIGVPDPLATLDMENQEPVTGSSTGMRIFNHAQTMGSSADDYRVGLEVKTSSGWSSNTAAKNIGIYVSGVSGQTNAEANLAAVLNGNVVVGSLSSADAIGPGGSNVLAIQNGTAPTAAVGSTATGGIQLYADNIVSGALAPPFSAIHIRSGNGDVIRLFKTGALTASNNTALGSGTYNPDTEAVINNLRTRINELEDRLKALGLLQ